MDHATIQNLINANRRRDGEPYSCRRCTASFRSWGSMWCPACRYSHYCGHQHRLLGHIIRSDGSKQGWWWCLTCGKITAARKAEGLGKFLLHDLRKDWDVPECERCGSAAGTQLHHWAPRAIFGAREADRWPTANLCPPCHSLWHRLMRKAGGARLPPEQRIDDYGTHPNDCNDTEDAA